MASLRQLTRCLKPPNGLRISRRLERMTLIDREGVLSLLDAKIAPIQLVGYMRLLGYGSAMAFQ
jgi:hypothetical protein